MIELASFTYDPIQRWGPVSPHGVGTALGFFLGAWLMARRAEPRGIPKSEIYNAVTWGAVGAILGARGFYIIGHWDRFVSGRSTLGAIRDMLMVWEGGLTMFGGFIGGLTLGLFYLYRKNYSIPLSLDAAAPGFALGVIIGRIGDMIIADHLGEHTDFFLGYQIPEAEIAPGYNPPYYAPGEVVHHTAMYDLAGALLLFGFIYLLQSRRPKTGALFAAFAIWYGLQRFAVDFTRNRELIESVFLGLSGSQWAGLAFAAGGIYALYRMYRRSAGRTAVPAGPAPPRDETPPERPTAPVSEPAQAPPAEPGSAPSPAEGSPAADVPSSPEPRPPSSD